MPPRQEGQDTRSWRWRVLLPLCAFSWAINNLLLEKEKGNCSCECWSIPAHAKKSCIKISENYKYKKWLDFHKRLGSTFCHLNKVDFSPTRDMLEDTDSKKTAVWSGPTNTSNLNNSKRVKNIFMRFFWICENLGYLWPFAVCFIHIYQIVFEWENFEKKFSKIVFEAERGEALRVCARFCRDVCKW